MWVFIISFLIFFLAIMAMAVGVIINGKSIKGSCGGIAGIRGLEKDCGACEKPCGTFEKPCGSFEKPCNKRSNLDLKMQDKQHD